MKNLAIKVLHIGADNIGYGGRSVIAYNLARYMDYGKIKNDFLAFSCVDMHYEKAIIKNGGKVLQIKLPKYTNKIRYEYIRSKLIVTNLKEQNYDIVHIHADNAYEAVKSVFIVKDAGINNIVIHAHNTGSSIEFSVLKKLIIKICKYIIKKSNYLQLACSNEAKEYMFGKGNDKKTYIIKDGIETKKFKYNQYTRKKIREEFGYNDGNMILGCVGRLSHQKNHIFLLNVFKKVLELSPEAKLLLVGDGELKNELLQTCNDLNISDSVVFLGNRNDVSDLLQAMDVFVLPSLYEGFGIVNLEAQCTGLPCVLSDNIPKFVKVTEAVTFLSLNCTLDIWVKEIFYHYRRNISNRKDCCNNVISCGFDIEQSSKKVESLYSSYFMK